MTTDNTTELLARWEARALNAAPVDSMIVNRHIRELREAPAAAQLVALMEAGALNPAPIWSDMLTFDGQPWRGAVDCIVAGFPCQDLSIAGRRAGLDGKRSGLFFRVLDIADAAARWSVAQMQALRTTGKCAPISAMK